MKEAVKLTEAEEQHVQVFVHRGKANARSITRARVALKLSEGWSDDQITAAFDICRATIGNVRKRFGGGGVEAVLHDKVQQHRRSVLSGLQTAHLIAVACSPSPDGHDHWTVRLLARDRRRVGVCDDHFAQYHSRIAQKNELKPWQHGARFVASSACTESGATPGKKRKDVVSHP